MSVTFGLGEVLVPIATGSAVPINPCLLTLNAIFLISEVLIAINKSNDYSNGNINRAEVLIIFMAIIEVIVMVLVIVIVIVVITVMVMCADFQ